MVNKKNSLLSVVAVFVVNLFAAGTLAAQNSETLRMSLARPGWHGSTAVVEAHGSAAGAIEHYNATHHRESSLRGYRVRIFFSNSQNAEHEAAAIRGRFAAQFPGIPTYMSYEAPSWIVMAGNCMSIDEFLILRGRVSPYYPTAFQWSGNIPISEFLKEADYGEAPEEIGTDAEDSESSI